MRSLRRLPFAAALVAALVLPAGVQAQSAQPRIISGSDVSSTTHPYQVRLTIRFGSGAFQCGGVIRDATHVMTAAHCLVSNGAVAAPGNVTVHYGAADRRSQSARSVYSVRAAPEYVAGDETYDAALLTLSEPLSGYGGPTVRPIGLAGSTRLGVAVTAGSNAVVTGWGLTEQGTTSQNLRATTVKLRTDNTCWNVFGGGTYVSARFVCAGGTGAQGSANNPDSCSGDSGGPLVLSTPTGYMLAGLVSFGPAGGCGRGGLPGAYTEVSNPDIYALLTGQTPPAPPPAPAPAPAAPVAPVTSSPDRTPPRIRLKGLRCRRHVCAIRLSASDNRGRVRLASAHASRRVQTCVTRRSGRRTCRRALRTRNLKLRRARGGFRGSVRLAPGSYRFTAAVTDAAGNRSRAVSVAFRVRR
ncbi:MAG TPA: serine protease [Thermoleophilaceae bacterium]|nr:serine protease [Thermoleophilaceae bacterium]